MMGGSHGRKENSMPTRIKDKNNTLLVKFYDDVGDVEARAMLATMGVSGTRVSALVKRWAVEVPYWREEEYLYKFYDSELVQAIHDSFDKDREAADAPEQD
jgi:hypothetical protein